jgi:molybdenum cofactor cytidylyltransferase
MMATGSGAAAVVLAAGAGTRFGGAKQLALVEGRPVLLRVLDAVEGFGSPQVVVLGAHVEAVETIVAGRDWRSPWPRIGSSALVPASVLA